MDEIDIRILELLQADGRMANADLARELQMAPSAVLERVRKLEQRKVITGFATRVEPKLVGLGLTAFLFVQIDPVKYSEHGHSELYLGERGERGHSTTAGERGERGHSTTAGGKKGHSTSAGGTSCCSIATALAAIPEVLEVHNVAGEDCFLIKVRVQDTSHLASLIREKVRSLPAIRSTRTTIVLETAKETTQLPLDHLKSETKKPRE